MYFNELAIGSRFKFNQDSDNAVLQKTGPMSYVVLESDYSNAVNLRCTVDKRYLDKSDPNLGCSPIHMN